MYKLAIELSGSVDAGFVPALPFHHGYLEPDFVERRGGGGLKRGIKIPLHDFALKMQGGLMREGGRICGTLRYILTIRSHFTLPPSP